MIKIFVLRILFNLFIIIIYLIYLFLDNIFFFFNKEKEQLPQTYNKRKEEKKNNCFWIYAFMWSAWTLNPILKRTMQTITSYECFYSDKPQLDSTRFFGFTAYILVSPKKRRKLNDRAVKGKVIGNLDESKGWVFLNTQDRSWSHQHGQISGEHVSLSHLKEQKPRQFNWKTSLKRGTLLKKKEILIKPIKHALRRETHMFHPISKRLWLHQGLPSEISLESLISTKEAGFPN
ncbi:uncharacterized protein VP01_1112g2 [Puccinia sorghi]|uniref:Retroviral polymerase SH3-like domain-containing protein n=1 Tax=Puccinia sorghi TaxID=27349 RepID=A0A0L6VSI9_9BASI|nr:uncharacterized protein VP01_1112g2 [Puccinia sorghi]